MTKKDFIEKIRKINNAYRRMFNDKCRSILINDVYFFYDCVKLCFDDDSKTLYIFDRNRHKIMSIIHYYTLRIGFDERDI